MGNKIDLIGRRFGLLLVVGESGKTKSGNFKWLCLCDCGKEISVASGNLRSRQKSCGCDRKPTIADLNGQIFGRLTVLEQAGKTKAGNVQWKCRCECGKIHVVAGSNLRRGEITSCGCSRGKWQLGDRNNRWKGGRKVDKDGYVFINIKSHPNANTMGYVREHVAVMSDLIGRPLAAGESVHHKNGVRHDNRIENLELWSTTQPAGQRVDDKVKWAKEILQRYENQQTNANAIWSLADAEYMLAS